MPLQWRNQLSVANDLIDGDHQHLIAIINRAEINIEARDRGALAEVIDELARYGKAHFAREERLAKAIGYARCEQLHVSHSQLMATLRDFRTTIGGDWPEDAVTQFVAFLRDWLVIHVIKEDLLMKPWLAKFSPSFSPD